MNDDLKAVVDRMEPHQALPALVEAIRELLSHLDEKSRVDQIVQLLGETGNDKVASLVDL